MTIYGQAMAQAVEFEKAMQSLRATFGQDVAELVVELARTTAWSFPLSKAVVEACFDRGMTLEQARDFCRAAVASPLPVRHWLQAARWDAGPDLQSLVVPSVSLAYPSHAVSRSTASG